MKGGRLGEGSVGMVELRLVECEKAGRVVRARTCMSERSTLSLSLARLPKTDIQLLSFINSLYTFNQLLST